MVLATVKQFLNNLLPRKLTSRIYNSKLLNPKKFDVKTNRKKGDWFSYSNFYNKILREYNFSQFAEVGVWKGHGVIYLAQSLKEKGIKNAHIYAIDLFDNVTKFEGTRFEKEAKKILEMFNMNIQEANVANMITTYQGLSWEMAKKFKPESLDLVFIDADHTYNSVTKDIQAYLPKIKSGGIISGHDVQNPEVLRAVYDALGESNVSLMKDSDTWWLEVSRV